MRQGKCTIIDDLKEAPAVHSNLPLLVFNRFGVAGAVLQSPL